MLGGQKMSFRNKIASLKAELLDQRFRSAVIRTASKKENFGPLMGRVLHKIATNQKISSIEKIALSPKDFASSVHKNGIFIVSGFTTKQKDTPSQVTLIPEDQWFESILVGKAVYEQGIMDFLQGGGSVQDALKNVSLTPKLLSAHFGHMLEQALAQELLQHLKPSLPGLSYLGTVPEIVDAFVQAILSAFLSEKSSNSLHTEAMANIRNSKLVGSIKNQREHKRLADYLGNLMSSFMPAPKLSSILYQNSPNDFKYRRVGRSENKKVVTDAMELFGQYAKIGKLDLSKMELLTAASWGGGAVGEQSFLFNQLVDFNVALDISNALKQDAFIWGYPAGHFPVMMYWPGSGEALTPAGVKLVNGSELSHMVEVSQELEVTHPKHDFLQVDSTPKNAQHLFSSTHLIAKQLQPSVILSHLLNSLNHFRITPSYHNGAYSEKHQLPVIENIIQFLPLKEYLAYFQAKFAMLNSKFPNIMGSLDFHLWLQLQDKPHTPVASLLDIDVVPTMEIVASKDGLLAQPVPEHADHLRVGANSNQPSFAKACYYYLINFFPQYIYTMVEKKYSVGRGGSFGFNFFTAGQSTHVFTGKPLTFTDVNKDRLMDDMLPISPTQ